MPVDYAAIGRRIKQHRRALGRTQEWLAERLQVSVGYVSQMERGVSRTNLDMLSEIALQLECELGELVTGVAAGQQDYLDRDLAAVLAQMNARQRSMLMEMADLILNY